MVSSGSDIFPFPRHHCKTMKRQRESGIRRSVLSFLFRFSSIFYMQHMFSSGYPSIVPYIIIAIHPKQHVLHSSLAGTGNSGVCQAKYPYLILHSILCMVLKYPYYILQRQSSSSNSVGKFPHIQESLPYRMRAGRKMLFLTLKMRENKARGKNGAIPFP